MITTTGSTFMMMTMTCEASRFFCITTGHQLCTSIFIKCGISIDECIAGCVILSLLQFLGLGVQS